MKFQITLDIDTAAGKPLVIVSIDGDRIADAWQPSQDLRGVVPQKPFEMDEPDG